MADSGLDLNRLHNVQMEIALEIKRICELYNIRYFLAFGTLLGAVRGDGFIPWDDDMDIGILREDYPLFLEMFKKHGNHEMFYLETWNEEAGYPFSFAKVKKNGTEYVGHAIRNADIHKGIFVDVFPYDRVPDDRNERKHIVTKVSIYQKLLKFKLKYLPINPKSKKQHLVAYIVRIFGFLIPKKTIMKRIESLEMKYYGNDSLDIACIISPYKLHDAVPASCYSEFLMHKFENEYFQIPKGYDKILTSTYGNYMELPPEDERHLRHFPERIKYE